MKIIAVVGARLNSSRLPGKHLLDLAGKPLIKHIFERLDHVPELTRMVLATTSDDYNRPLVEWAQANQRQVLAYAGDVNDLMGRVDAAFQEEQGDILVYICGDCPLLEPGCIRRMLAALRADPQADYVAVTRLEGQAVIHQGIDIFTRRIWEKTLAASHSAAEREHVGSARHKILAQMEATPLTEPGVFYQVNHRISVDTPSDYAFMSILYDRWYAHHPAEEIVSLPWVVEMLHREPHLRAINQQVHQKRIGEVSLPILLVCSTGALVGLGHLRRMLELAAALVDHYAAGVRLLVEGDSLEMAELNLLPHHITHDLAASLQDLAQKYPYHAVVCDLPQDRLGTAEQEELHRLSQQGVRVISVDFAIAREELYCFNWVPCFYLDPERASQGQHYWGWEHYLLPTVVTGIQRAEQSVLILSGGSDSNGLGEELPTLLENHLPQGTAITWVRGPFAKQPKLIKESKLAWRVVHHPNRLVNLMTASSHALVVYGVSLFECLAQGVACVAVTPHMDEKCGELLAFDEAKIAPRAAEPEQAVRELVNLLTDSRRSKQNVSRAQTLLDGRGAQRLASKIMNV